MRGFLHTGRFFLVLLVVGALSLPAKAQLTKIMGRITDARSGEPLPFVNIQLKGTTYGISTGFDGAFSMETRHKGDTLTISYIGYRTVQLKINPGHFQQFEIKLEPVNLELGEVVIVPGENPAEVIMRKLIAAKPDNRRDMLDHYQYEAYTRIQFDANNLAERFMDRRAFRKMDFIFDYVDTSTVSGKTYLPVFLTESVSEMFYRRQPTGRREVIKGLKISGVSNESVGPFLGNMYQEVYIYDNYITLFDKNFVSPCANFGLSYYRYYLVDSSFIDGQWCYMIQFRPRRRQELTFTGSIWVHDTSFAVRIVDMKAVEDANINFVNQLVIYQEYQQLEERYWMLSEDKLVIDFNPLENSEWAVGVFGRRSSSYRDYILNQAAPREIFSNPLEISLMPEASSLSNEQWTEMRHDSLSRDEKTIYWLVDTVTNLPVFQTWVDVVQMVVTGYYVHKNLEYGPYMSTLSFNELEGTRIRLGARTSNAWSTRLMLSAHLAWGARDEAFKYKGAVLYMFNKHPRRSAGFDYKHDLEQLGKSRNAFREDFLLASLLRRNPADKLSMVDEYMGFYEYEWFPGFSTTINLIHRNLKAHDNSPFALVSCQNCTDYMSELISAEVRMDVHFALKEKFVFGEFERVSLGTTYPVFDLAYSFGPKGILGSDYRYHAIEFRVKHWFNIGSLGWSKYIIETGQVFGKLPYPLLKLHEGNETFTFDEYAFNTMNYYEFVSDRYISLYYTHHFDGLFLNRIPLLRKLKWREVVFARGLTGTLSDENRAYVALTPGLQPLSKPYFEAGAGIENIFRIFRVDAIWRLSYLDHQNINPFAVLLSMQFYL